MYDAKNFSLQDMAECSAALRVIGKDAGSMEETANRIVRHLYDNLVEKESGEPAFALVRLFKTHDYGNLNEELRVFAKTVLDDPTESADMKCLTLLATAGMQAEWNSRENSRGHKAIPLPSPQVVERFPMIRQLMQQMGLEVNTVLKPNPDVLLDLAQKTYNVFFIPDATDSPYVPAQQDFVIPYGVRSVIGFGGLLPNGSLYAIIMFSRVSLSRETAEMFRTLALSAKLAILPFGDDAVFM